MLLTDREVVHELMLIRNIGDGRFALTLWGAGRETRRREEL
jgi:hypothetical protein